MIFFLKVHPQEKKIILLTFPHILPALSGKNAHIKEARLNIVWNSYLKLRTSLQQCSKKNISPMSSQDKQKKILESFQAQKHV